MHWLDYLVKQSRGQQGTAGGSRGQQGAAGGAVMKRSSEDAVVCNQIFKHELLFHFQ